MWIPSNRSAAAPRRTRIASAPSDKPVDDPTSEEAPFIQREPTSVHNSVCAMRITVCEQRTSCSAVECSSSVVMLPELSQILVHQMRTFQRNTSRQPMKTTLPTAPHTVIGLSLSLSLYAIRLARRSNCVLQFDVHAHQISGTLTNAAGLGL